MNKFSAEEFYKLGEMFQRILITEREIRKDTPDYVFGESDADAMLKLFDNALDLASSIGLKITAKWLLDARAATKVDAKPEIIGQHVWGIKKTLEKEMDGQLFLYVPSTRAEFYDKDPAVFLGDKCRDNFASVLPEIDEAMKCYAVGRYTACAFHLMRATEAGTKALGEAIGAKVRNNNWGDVFKEYDRQLALPPAARPAHWSTHGEFLENIAANLRGAKTLRNSVAHLDESYTEERAAKLMVLIPEFLRQLAEKMDEKGNLL